MATNFVVVWSGTSRFLAEVVRSKLDAEEIPAELLPVRASDMAPHHSVVPEWEVRAPAEHAELCAGLLAETETSASPFVAAPLRARLVGWVFFAVFIGIPAVVIAIRLFSS